MNKPPTGRKGSSVEIPEGALYGTSTQQAVNNFSVSEQKMPGQYISALGKIKKACAKANVQLGQLDDETGQLIIQASSQVEANEVDDHFPVSVFQIGSGTSTNMNANEVIANIANKSIGACSGANSPVHPNDHVNLGQSSNDIIPSALNISLCQLIKDKLIYSLKELESILKIKAKENRNTLKLGRTHLMDAVPMTFEQQFKGYGGQIKKAISKLNFSVDCLRELTVGGTAIGTALNTHPKFGHLVCSLLAEETGIKFKVTKNHFACQSNIDELVMLAGTLITVSTSIKKIASDIKLMASGPRAGLNEINVPALQPGSSIMPGKNNPVICESVVQVCNYIFGQCYSVMLAGQDGHLQLNTNLPLTISCLINSIELLNNTALNFSEKCLEKITVNKDKCSKDVENSLMLATLLVPEIGYDKATEIAQKAYKEKISVLDAAKQMTQISKKRLKSILKIS